MNSADINNFRQNHPELVVRDLASVAAPDQVRQVLKYRGVYKWLRVRRLLIQLKERWKDEINALMERERHEEEWRKREFLRGYRKALTDARQQVRALCHSPRDVEFPDRPSEWGEFCALPSDFPARPHKRWFWRSDARIQRKRAEQAEAALEAFNRTEPVP